MKLKGKVKFVPTDRTQFFSVLKSRVDGYFEERGISQHSNAEMWVKSAVMLSLYVLPFLVMVAMAPTYSISLALWAVMGIGIAGIGMSVMHDANHGSYSDNSTVNWLMGHTLNLLGGSVLNWKLQHNILHHTYTNISGMDDDIADRLVLRFSPHTKTKWVHRAQRWYAIFFYGLLTLYWVVAKDLVQFVLFSNNGVNPNSKAENRVLLIKIIAMKLFALGTLLGLPVWLGHYTILQVLGGFLLMHFVSGVILTVTFQLAHTVEGTSHPLPNEHGVIENDWAIHQIETTVNFSRGNWPVTWYVGGLNYQIEHHLFPKVCHVHYPAIAPIVKATCAEYGINYMEHTSLAEAIRSHFRTLERFGLPTMNAAIG